VPRNASLLIALQVIAIVIVVGVFILFRRDAGTERAPSDPSASDRVLAQFEDRLERIEREVFGPRPAGTDSAARFDAIEARLGQLEGKNVATVEAGGDGEPAAPALADLKAQSLDQLFARGRSLEQGGGSGEDRLELYREIISREPSGTTLAHAWIGAGLALRSLQRHAEEGVAFEEALRAAGAGSEQGVWATYQMAWARYLGGDPAAGRATMEELASASGTPRGLAGHATLYAGTWALQQEDPVGARRAFERILADHGDSVVPESQWLADQARKNIEGLDRLGK
jgi:tetratricopeptide (TPR) repeat protein